MAVELEIDDRADGAAVAARAANRLREALGLTVPVTLVSAGVLPRFEMKARRFILDRLQEHS
jgi:phenylacetate-coenzyme A ligase PaaK-like adenylate-forming protein